MENCPLSGGGQAIESLPGVCHKNCFHLWEHALQTQAGEAEAYPALTEVEECSHLNVAFSHEALQAVDSSPKRLYSIVDQCEDCQRELMETGYTFRCSAN